MKTTYTDARANLARLLDQVSDDQETVIITRRGKADVALIAADELDALLETAQLLRSPRNAARLLAALQRALARTEPAQSVAELRRDLAINAEA